ncbi:PulJ/GspJ family protein [Puniceicoccus vermicola]|uniref:Type II secretion system protein n=1 Tax=Puniceicoccus vermicola TaxID=388746 RepID=A0A7X1B291_9BACT|nr:type II secretion system protein [Puniceicoccus vermicola]MBC2604187.1 type II secretion system protein [Puniceicoccus vermicola]
MKKRATQGFTLIELLVASGVTAIIVGLMITMVSNLLTAYNRSSGALSAQSQAGFVLDQLTTELESLVVRNTGDVMLAATIRGGTQTGKEWGRSAKPAGTSLVIPTEADPAGALTPIEDLRFGVGGVWLRFFTSAPTLSGDPNGGVRAVGYRMELDRVTSAEDAPIQYMLYRGEVRAQDTFNQGYDLSPGSGDYTAEVVLLNPGDDQIIAGNVVDFGVRLYDTNSDRERELVFPLNSGDTSYLASGTGTEKYPRSVEVMVRILTPEGVRLVDAMRSGNLTGQDWWTVVNQNSSVFSRMINIPSRPL